MRALVCHGPGLVSWDSVADPSVAEPTDVVVRVDATTICASDLRILAAGPPTVPAGRVLGHEAVGTVVATGSAVSALADGDRVVIPAITSCGRCGNCGRGMPGHCERAGWILGNTADGLQAEYARVPYAETSVHRIPEGVTDADALFLADVVPTGYELGIRKGGVIPGDTVAVVGLGPVGLAAVMTAGLHGAGRVVAIGTSPARLAIAGQFGATHTIDSTGEDPVRRLREITGGEGADVAIEAVGTPGTFETCTRIVRPGGVVANIGVHREPVTLRLDQLWRANLTITTGIVDTVSVPMLLRLVRDGRLHPGRLATHEFTLSRIADAYALAAGPDRRDVLKILLTP